MPNIANGVIFIWPSTNASIPSGWVRETLLDGKYPKGTAFETNPGQTGGTATHTHVGSSHTHTLTAHTHTISIARNATNNANDSDNDAAHAQHTHANSTSGAMTVDTVSYATGTYSAFSNDPPYTTVIFIKPATYEKYLPDNAIYLYEDADPEDEADHYICDGDNSTTDLTDMYLKGASPGADGGDTGGTTTNTHTIAHTHSQSHDHADSTSGAVANNTNANRKAATAGTYPNATHTHTVYLESNTESLVTSFEQAEAETVEPAYTKLLAVQNKTGGDSIRTGMIGLWLGTLNSIPNNYSLTDTNLKKKHIKITDTIGNIGDTGGANTHTHAAYSHGYTLAHIHTGQTSGNGDWDRGATSGTFYLPASNHDHPVTVASTNLIGEAANVTATSSNNEPLYRTVAFIKLNKLSVAGESNLLLNFL